MEHLGKITGLVAIILYRFLTSLLMAYVILSVSNLYQLDFVTQLSLSQIYGALMIIWLIKYRHAKLKGKDASFVNKLKKWFDVSLTTAGVTLAAWGLSFVAHKILF